MTDTRRRRALPPTDAAKAVGVQLADGVIASAPEPATPVAAPTPQTPVEAVEPAKATGAAPTTASAPSAPQKPVQPRPRPVEASRTVDFELPEPDSELDPEVLARWEHWLNATAGKFGATISAAQKAKGAWERAVADARAADVDEDIIVVAAKRARVPVPPPPLAE